MLSLIELQGKKVEAKRKKYEQYEMDTYLELVFDNYKSLLEENKKLEAEKAELNKKIKTLSDGVQYYRSIETTLQKALILAEKTSKETKDAAILKAESIEKEAHKRADHIVHNAEEEYNKIRNKSIRLVQQFNQYKLQLKEAASAQLQLVEGDEFDISKPDDLEKPLHETVSEDVSANVTKPPVKEKPPVPPVREAEQRIKREAAAPSPAAAAAKEKTTLDTTREEILNADTIDLRTTLDAVKTEADFVEIKEPAPEPVTAPVKQPEPLDRIEPPKAAEVKNAAILEPVAAKTIEPMDVVFEDELSAGREEKPERIEPIADKGNDTVPTLDSLLQDLNFNNRKNQKSDDPFEFLGSVDDF